MRASVAWAPAADWAAGATDRAAHEAREGFYRAVQKVIDDEAAAMRDTGPPR